MRQRPSFHSSVLALTLIVLGVMAVTPARQLYDQHRQTVEAQRDLERLGAQNARLQARLDRLNDPDYVERLARKELGFVRPGEVSFLVVPPDPPPAPPEPASPPPRPKPKLWYEQPWERVRALLSQR
jgi:cell division protein FtsB